MTSHEGKLREKSRTLSFTNKSIFSGVRSV
jgi:hypothetical protein